MGSTLIEKIIEKNTGQSIIASSASGLSPLTRGTRQ